MMRTSPLHGFPKIRKMRTAQSLGRFIVGGEGAVEGIAATEFGLIAPMLALLMIGTLDLGLGAYRDMQVQNAAQAGSQYAVAHGFDAGAMSSAITTATSLAGISASPAPSQFCGCPSSSGLAVVACSSTCSGSPVGTYVTASAQATYTTVLAYPLLPKTFTFMAQSTVRIQ